MYVAEVPPVLALASPVRARRFLEIDDSGFLSSLSMRACAIGSDAEAPSVALILGAFEAYVRPFIHPSIGKSYLAESPLSSSRCSRGSQWPPATYLPPAWLEPLEPRLLAFPLERAMRKAYRAASAAAEPA